MTPIQSLISELRLIKDKRKEIESTLAELKRVEAELAKAVQAGLESLGLDTATADGFPVKLQKITQPKADDWPAFYGYVKANDAFELLHKRLSVTAIKERWDAGETIHGVSAVSFNKLKY